MLHVAHAVQHQFTKGEIERSVLTQALRLLVGQICQDGTAFLATISSGG